MDNERVVNYETVIENINKHISEMFFGSFISSFKSYFGKMSDLTIADTPLALIYDYQKCNDYAKVIMEKAKFRFTLPDARDTYGDKFENAKKTIGTARKFVELCGESENVTEGYKFIFWALMILTVDKTDEEEHLSLISDYAKMLCITEDEFEDLIRTVKMIYNREKSYTRTEAPTYQGGMRIVFSQNEVYCFKSRKVANIFGKLFDFMSE